MVLTVDQLKELPIKNTRVHLKRVIVDYKKIQAVGVVLAKKGLFGRTLSAPFSVLTQVQPAGVTLDQQALEKTENQLPTDPERFGDLTEREVFTERKRYLGKLVTYKVDTDTGLITALWVKPPLVLRDLWRQILLISRSQIVTITPRAIVVDEAVIKSALKPATAAELNREPETSFGAASVADPNSNV